MNILVAMGTRFVKPAKQLDGFMRLVLLHQVCLQSMSYVLIKVYTANCKQTYVDFSVCLKIFRSFKCFEQNVNSQSHT